MQCKARQDKARQGKAGREDVTAERLPSSAVQCMHAEGFTSSMTNFNPNFLLMISLYAVQNACAYPFETISCTCSAVQIDWKITRMIRYAVITHMICTQWHESWIVDTALHGYEKGIAVVWCACPQSLVLCIGCYMLCKIGWSKGVEVRMRMRISMGMSMQGVVHLEPNPSLPTLISWMWAWASGPSGLVLQWRIKGTNTVSAINQYGTVRYDTVWCGVVRKRWVEEDETNKQKCNEQKVVMRQKWQMSIKLNWNWITHQKHDIVLISILRGQDTEGWTSDGQDMRKIGGLNFSFILYSFIKFYCHTHYSKAVHTKIVGLKLCDRIT